MAPNADFGRLGPYSLLATVAEGGMARVYLAKHEESQRVCVLKQLHHELEDHETAMFRFRREAAIASKIDHPNVAKILDSGFDADRFYIGIEFVAGQTIEDLMKASSIPSRVGIALIAGMLDGLSSVHGATDEHGNRLAIVHRDITPRNVMVSYAGEVKIIDFGIARADVDRFRTSPGVVLGSIRYMAPEQARTVGVDARSDLYSVAVMLYELLTGRPVLSAGDIPRGSIESELPERLAKVVIKGTAKQPSRRFQSALEFRNALLAACPDPATPDEISRFVRSLFASQERETLWLLQAVNAEHREPPFEDADPPAWSIERSDVGEDPFEDPTEVAEPMPRTPPPSAIQDPMVIGDSIRSLDPGGSMIFSFAEIALEEVVLLLHQARFTGCLELGDAPNVERVLFRNGGIAGTSPSPLLDAALLREALRAFVDDDALHALPLGITDLDPDLLGNYLVERGLIDVKQLSRARTEQGVHRMFGLFNRRDRIARIREGARELVDFVDRPIDLRPVLAYGTIVRSDPHRKDHLRERLRNQWVRLLAPYDEQRNYYWLPARIMEAIRPLASEGIQLDDRPTLGRLDESTTLGVLLLFVRLSQLEIGTLDSFDHAEITVRVSSTPSR